MRKERDRPFLVTGIQKSTQHVNEQYTDWPAWLPYHNVTPGCRSFSFSIFVLLQKLFPSCLLLSLEGNPSSKMRRKLSTREASAGQRSPSCLNISDYFAQTHPFVICQVSLNPVQHLYGFHNEKNRGIRIT